MNVASHPGHFTVKEGTPEKVWTLQRRICFAFLLLLPVTQQTELHRIPIES